MIAVSKQGNIVNVKKGLAIYLVQPLLFKVFQQ